MNQSLDTQALEQAFFNARTFNKFTSQKVSDALIMQLYDLMKWGPTSGRDRERFITNIKS
jgi:3-hydroxypropanoate dehydrogenase